MDTFVIGNAACSLGAVVELLSSSPVSQTLFEKLSDVSRSLQVPHHDWEKIRLGLLHDKIQNTDALYKVLSTWKMMAAGKATLGVLVQVLQKQGLNELAEILCREFAGIDPPSTTGCSSSSSLKKSEADHIRDNLDVLLENTHITAMLLAKLEVAKILHFNEIDELEATLNKADRNAKFWKLMRKKQPGQYRMLITVMQDLCQDKVAGVLKELYYPCH